MGAKTLIAALLFTAGTALANRSATTAGNSFSEASLVTRVKAQNRDLLKVKKPVFFSANASGIPGLGSINGGGLFLNAGLFFPFSNYLDPHGVKSYKMGYDAEWGHYFKLIKVKAFSIGIRATWLSGSYVSYQDIVTVNSISASALRVGIQSMIALGDKAAINIFYQLGGNYTIELAGGSNLSYLGLTHEIGAGIQYRIINLGTGFRFGGLTNVYNSDKIPKDNSSFSVSGFRVYVGLKF